MTALCEDTLIKIAELMSSVASLKAVAAAAGISESCLYTWRAHCLADQKKNDLSSPYLIHFRDQAMWWTEACARARQEHLISLESQIRAEAAGVEVPVRGPSQEIVYKLDPRFVGRSDDYVKQVLGLDPIFEDVEKHHRYLKGPDGLPVVDTRIEHLPAQLRLRVLETADPSYRPHTHQSVDVDVKGSIVHEAKPLARRPDEPRADLAELRKLASLTPEQRRAKFGASPYPKDARGNRTLPSLPAPINRDQPDDQNLGKKPVEPFVRPQQPAPAPDPGRPSYAKPQRTLDTGERTGRGEPPPGGGPAHARGNVR